MISATATFTRAVVIGCLGWVLGPVCSGQTPPSEVAAVWLGDPGVDVAKARARRLEAKAAWLRWEQATTLDDYDRVGQKDSRWDADVRATLAELAHALAREPDTETRTSAAKGPCQRALAAGCKDPLLAYLALRLGLYPAGTTPVALARLYAQAEQDMEKSGYSPLRKLNCSFRAAEQMLTAVGKESTSGEPSALSASRDIDASLGRAATHLLDLLRDSGAQRESVYYAADAFLRFAQHTPAARVPVLDLLELAFESDLLRDAGKTEVAQLVQGMFWIDYAWQGRTTSWSKDVTEEGWSLFAERLLKAEAALAKAYAQDAADPHVCYGMMTVELGQNNGRERLETWFRRAMDADPDSYEACSSKLYYLEPKWYGNAATMLEFGRQCLATANWPARLPFILLSAHAKLAADAPVPADYWKKPDVWAEVQGLYQAALAANPDSLSDRSGYALAAYRAEQWTLADRLFRALGDKPDLNAMQCSRAQFAQMRASVASHAQPPPSPVPQVSP